MRIILVAIAAVAMVGCGAEEKFAGEAELPKLDVLAADLNDFILCLAQ